MFRRNTEKYITFTVPIENENTGIDKNGEEITKKIYLAYYNLLIVQGLWQNYYQILSIILLNDFIELNVNLDTMIKNVKPEELQAKYATVFLMT